MLLFKNLRLFAKQSTGMFLLLIVTQILAVVVILFSYGVYVNNQYTLQEKEDATMTFLARLCPDKEAAGCAADLKEHLAEFLEPYDGIITSGVLLTPVEITQELPEGVGIENATACSYYTFRKHRYVKSDSYLKNAEIYRPIPFSEEQLNNGEKVCLISGAMAKALVGEEYFSVDGEEYLILGFTDEKDPMPGVVEIPLCSLGDNMKPLQFYLQFSRSMTFDEYTRLRDNLSMYFPDAEFDEFEAYEVDDVSCLKTMMLACVFLSVLAAITISTIYNYLMQKRNLMTAVYQICGGSTLQTVGIYLGEMSLLLMVTAALGGGIFYFLVEPRMEKYFHWFSVIFAGKTSLWLLAIYVAVVFVFVTTIMWMSLRLAPKERLRRCGN